MEFPIKLSSDNYNLIVEQVREPTLVSIAFSPDWYSKQLGLWVGQDTQPTGVVRFDTHVAPLGLLALVHIGHL